jgi:hypothetical protein
MAALAAVTEAGAAPPPSIVTRLASLDPADETWRAAAAALVAAVTADERRAAAIEAMNLVSSRARGRLAPAGTARSRGRSDEWAGWWAEEIRDRSPR